MADIEPELQALRGQIARVKSELEALAEAESVLSEKLRTLGLDESITMVDLPTVAGLPSRRKKRPSSSSSVSSSVPPPKPAGPVWVPAAVGAGLLLGVAIVVLLAMNLQQAKRAESVVAAPPVTSVMVLAPRDPIPPPPPVETTPPVAAPASAEAPKPEMGQLSIVCTPRCDSIFDNGTPLTPGNVVALPVAAGPHKVVVTSGAVKRTMSVTIAPGQQKELRVDLEKGGPDRGF
ncbi:MAG: hypothetical protein U0270_44660 [Labilithrix sp.]